MPSTGTRAQFIEDIAKYVQKYAPQYGILVNSPIIAQADIESKYGESTLGYKYHNYFGLKCGSKWKGPSVNMKTKEEYTPGTYTEIKDNFRVYSSMEEGVKGYFDFISASRYANLKGVTDPETYVTNIKNDGYATSSAYVSTIMNNINFENLTRFDKVSTPTPAPTPVKPTVYSPDVILNIAYSYLGASESNGRYKEIIDIYNTQNPLPSGYRMKYTDPWCATFVSTCAIVAGYTAIIPTECSCSRMIEKYKSIGCWREDESITPQKGWVIFYDWQDNGVGDNVGNPDHVGYVYDISGGTIRVIEGNYNDAVGIRSIAVNGKCIRGYGIPKYSVSSNTPVPVPTTPTKPSNTTVSKQEKYKACVNAHKLNVRTWAGTNYSQVSFSPLSGGTIVGVCDTIKSAGGKDWNYINYNGKYGFCSATYLTPIDSKYAGNFEVHVNTVLNLRSGPGINNSVIAKMPNKSKVTCYGESTVVDGDTWLKVTYNNITGYCSAKYLIKL